MTAADIEAVAALEEALFGLEAWPPRMLAGELRGRDGGARYYLVAEEDSAVAGYGGLLAPRGGPADIVTLAVARHRWGAGIGTSLLLGLLAEAARRGCREVFLEVRVDNDRAQGLYRRHGFAGIGVRRGYYQPSGTDALVMRRELAPPGVRPGQAELTPPASGDTVRNWHSIG
jgi:[ribosomal protein S18]-alanine N-acetyltransferase